MANYRKIVENLIGRKLSRHDVVHHKDGNHENNSVENLEIMSLSEHSRMHNKGKVYSPETIDKLQKKSRQARPGAIIAIEDVRDIRKMLKDGIKQYLIAFAFGINKRTVNDINCGRSWTWA